MWLITGRVTQGVKHFSKKIITYPKVFEDATGEKLYPGTINVNVVVPICINEHFRIKDPDPQWPNQVLVFEVCRINGFWAYRIRPYDITNGSGGHGDDVVEISCSQKIHGIEPNVEVKLEFFRSF